MREDMVGEEATELRRAIGAKEIKAKVNKWDPIKLKIFWSSRRGAVVNESN